MTKEFVHRVQRWVIHLSSGHSTARQLCKLAFISAKEAHKHVSERRTVSGFNCSRLLDHLQRSRQLKGKGSQEERSMVDMLLA